MLLALTIVVILGYDSRGTHDHILFSKIRDSPRNRVAQSYPQPLASLFIAFCESQGYGGGIRPRLRTGFLTGSNLVCSL
jgi:hypothetical protein